jgi:predicted MFS family arabinose efflux permease
MVVDVRYGSTTRISKRNVIPPTLPPVPGASTTALNPAPPDDGQRPLTGALVALFGARFGGNVLLRFPFVFLSTITQGLGISLGTATTILGIRELGGLATPIPGRIADHGHERRVIVSLTALAGVTTIVAPFFGRIGVVTLVLFLGGFAKFGIDAAQGAWISHRVDFARRGRVLGLMEVSWSAAFLVGMPICAWAIDEWGWKAPFVGTGALLLVFAAAQWVALPRDVPQPRHPDEPKRPRVHIDRSLRGVMAFAAFQPFAQMLVFAVVTYWFSRTLHMSDQGVGLNTAVIGLAELAGSVAAATLADRVGKRRMGLIGLGIATPMLVALGLVGDHAIAAVAVLMVMDAGLEGSFVSVLPLVTELDPNSRAAAIGLTTVIITLARASATWVAGRIYDAWGFTTVCLVAAMVLVLGFVSLWRFVVEPGHHRR